MENVYVFKVFISRQAYESRPLKAVDDEEAYKKICSLIDNEFPGAKDIRIEIKYKRNGDDK